MNIGHSKKQMYGLGIFTSIVICSYSPNGYPHAEKIGMDEKFISFLPLLITYSVRIIFGFLTSSLITTCSVRMTCWFLFHY